MRRTILAWAIIVGTVVPGHPRLSAADDQTENAPPLTGDAFFAGIVAEFSAAKITVSRTIRGQPESRSFRVTPQTRVEGKLAQKVRVTVGYITDDNGEVATMIVVRANAPQPVPKSKK